MTNHATRTWALIAVALASTLARGDDAKPAPVSPRIAPASDEAQKAIRGFRVPEGLSVELFAAEPLLANPVAFSFDGKGVLYVAETFRHGEGVFDTRGHLNWLDDDMACRSVADRVAMYRKYLGAEFATIDRQQERVRRIVDRDGDGKADSATVFADGFNNPAAGIGAGVLARGGQVWYSCIPWLWRLEDRNGDGKADQKDLLHEGYGVHVGFLGHDLHGLTFGPDGRLYLSIGDRGFNVLTREGKRLTVPDTGSVLRCEPDGTRLEVFAAGLRNPQELAFNELGDLFTCDNNSDSGDKARWVHLIEGGDCGWRIGYQFIGSSYSRGPWNEEKLWYPAFAGQAAFIIPPLANLSDGPSGLVYNPGVTLLPDRYKGHFFLVDFRGASGQSGIRSFALEPAGPSYRLVDSQQFLWRDLATDVDFGPDGGLYFSDWVEGWEKTGKGRVYRVLDPGRRGDPRVGEVREILAKGLKSASVADLARLLGHADVRVREEAQFELVDRGGDGLAALAGTAANAGAERLARLHAIWGLGQIGRRKPEGSITRGLEAILNDQDHEIRAQAAKIIGELHGDHAAAKLASLLADPSPRARMAAAIALGKLGSRQAGAPLLAMLRTDGADPFSRHAAVMGLVGTPIESWRDGAKDASATARMGVLLALRRLENPEVAAFLTDAEPAIVLEAARAIHDKPIPAALPRLAAVPIDPKTPMPLVRRVLAANLRLGGEAGAGRLVATAAREDLSDSVRLLAVESLVQWPNPPGRDPVLGLWRPIPAHAPAIAATALGPRLPSLYGTSIRSVRSAAIRAASALSIRDAGRQMARLAVDPTQSDETRATALRALGATEDSGRLETARSALVLEGPASRVEALRLIAKLDPSAAYGVLEDRLDHGTVVERQGVIAILAGMSGARARDILMRKVKELVAGKAASDVVLDLIDAAEVRKEPEFRRLLDDYNKGLPASDPLAKYRASLDGGDPRKGQAIFFASNETACLRCHKVRSPAGETSGGEVGPDLSRVGALLSREALLEAIVVPSKTIARGFDSVVLLTSDGKVHTGVLRGEDDKTVRLITAEGVTESIAKDTIEERKQGPSAMPADVVEKLGKRGLRDVVAYLSELKAKDDKPGSAKSP